MGLVHANANGIFAFWLICLVAGSFPALILCRRANASDMIVKTYALCLEGSVAIVGTRFSDDSKIVAYTSMAFGLPQVSWGSSSADFSVKANFPLFSRVYPDVGQEMLQLAAVLEHFAWRKVAVVYSNDATGGSMFSLFGAEAARRGIRILTSAILTNPAAKVKELAQPCQTLKDSNALIIVDLSNFSSLRRKFLKASTKAGLRGPEYQWSGCGLRRFLHLLIEFFLCCYYYFMSCSVAFVIFIIDGC